MTDDNEVSPYDPLWGWVALATISWSVVIALVLTTGGNTLLPDPDAFMQDDRRATVAYYGALGSFAGLAALGLIAGAYVQSEYANRLFPWPRVPKLEGEKRARPVAKVVLAVALLLPLFGGAMSLTAYFDTSRIACWDSSTALAQGFWSSRLEALKTTCPSPEQFRMAPLDGAKPDAHQWFLLSDILAVALIVLGCFAWGRYLYRLRGVLRSS